MKSLLICAGAIVLTSTSYGQMAYDWTTSVTSEVGQLALSSTGTLWVTQYGPGIGPTYVQNVYRYSTTGSYLGMTLFTPTGIASGCAQTARDITTDASGNAFVLLQLSGGIASGGGFLVAKINTSGTVVWAKAVYGISNPKAIKTGSLGQVFVLTENAVYQFNSAGTQVPATGPYDTWTITGASSYTTTALTVMNDQPYVAGWASFPSPSPGYMLGFVASPAFPTTPSTPGFYPGGLYMPGLISQTVWNNGNASQTFTSITQQYNGIGNYGGKVYPLGQATTQDNGHSSEPFIPLWASYATPSTPPTSTNIFQLQGIPWLERHLDAPEYSISPNVVSFDGQGNVLYGGYFMGDNGSTGGMIVARYPIPGLSTNTASYICSNSVGLTAWPSYCTGIVATASTVWALGGDGSNMLFKLNNTAGGLVFNNYAQPPGVILSGSTAPYSRGIAMGPTGQIYVLTDHSLTAYH